MVPEIEEGRFYKSQWDDLWGYVLDNVGSPNDGNDGTSVLLAAPDWEGELPEGLDRVIQGESQFLGSLTRTQAYSPDDMENVRAIQEQYELQPLSAFLGEEAPEAAPEIDWMPWEEGDETTLKYWEYVADLLPYIEPHEQDAEKYEQLAALSIERGEEFDAQALSPEMQEAMQGGIDEARELLTEWGNNITDAKLFFNTREIVGADYQSRATGVFAGIFGNTGEVSVYFTIATDSEGELLDGSENDYTITFADGELPPVEFFWSMTMYELPSRWLVENPIDRYSIGSATEGVETAEDGSLTLYISQDSPGEDQEPNWLPAPDGPFWMVLRNYGPDQSIIDGSYQVPPVTPAD